MLSPLSTIWMVDDQTLIRQSLKDLIEKIGPYQVTAHFASGKDFLAALEQTIYPDLVLLDLRMPAPGGEEVMEQLARSHPKLRVLVLTQINDASTVNRLFRLGVRGYLLKNCQPDELQIAIATILEKGHYKNQYFTVSQRQQVLPEEKAEVPAFHDLILREQIFLSLVCDENEFTYEEIARQMSVSTRTVDGYRESLFEKFGVKSKTGLVLYVLKHNLIQDLRSVRQGLQ